jgi:hypothetical protein
MNRRRRTAETTQFPRKDVAAMLRTTRIFRVFVASPGDVQRERDSLLGVVNELNRTLDALLPQTPIRVELERWETDVVPDMGRAQEVINSQIKPYDIFIGIFWKRFGTPTGNAGSGTEEEFQIAFNTWRKHGRPRILFYFNRAAMVPPRSVDEIDQLKKIVEFRQNLEGLTQEYDGAGLFMDTVRPHLVQAVADLIHENGRSTKRIASRTLPPLRDVMIPLGETVQLVEIGPQDACYPQQSKYVDRAGTVIEAQQQDGWLRGTFRFDGPLFPGDNRLYSFLQFRVGPGDRVGRAL